MAKNIISQVAGGTKSVFDNVETVSDVATKLGVGEGYTAAINGDTAELHEQLEDGDMVTFSKAVKGGVYS